MALTLALGLLSACSLVFNPERTDGLVRCSDDDDCPPTDDNRHMQKCMLSEDVDLEGVDAEKVCVAVFEPLSCFADHYDIDSRFSRLYRAANANKGVAYKDRCPLYRGKQGCPPLDDGTCESGLEVHPDTQMCDDDDPLTPPALRPATHVAGYDVRDQFCRSYFCDMSFVCANLEVDRCVPCTLGKSLGFGGCGELYFEGKRSPIYQSESELEQGCRAPDSDPEAVEFGLLYSPPDDDPGM